MVIRLNFKPLLGIGLLLAMLNGCVDRYLPEVISAPARYLVVDGFVNLNGVTIIRLSRTQALAATTVAPAESQATVSILDESGITYPLTEQEPGRYTSANLNLRPEGHYQLRLRTAAGRDYASDLVAARQTPAIDSVTWALTGPNVQIYVNTHDASNNARYYRWDFTETWEFRSAYQSNLEYVNNKIQPRAEDVYTCWRTENSTAIKLSNTMRLSQDVVAKFPLHAVAANAGRLSRRYSILVRQHAQTAEEYAYWEQLQKNTESLGTLFDPLPSQLTGNVHCLSDAAEPVLGYVGAASSTEQRIFISQNELPPTRFLTGYESCGTLDTVLLANVPTYFGSQVQLPVYPIYLPRSSTLLGYAAGTAECIDCRRRGTNQKPSFWP
jgi:hypothetical protein